jgi:hypothetical protein
VGVVLVVTGWVVLRRRRARDPSRVTSALTVVGILVGLSLWFWGPCEVARLELPWLVVPPLQGHRSSWGWRGQVADALRDVVANGPIFLTWGVMAAATIRTWLADRRGGRARAWVWTEPAACAGAVVAAFLFTIVAGQGPAGLIGLVSWLVGGLVSWWITGHDGVGHGL